VTAAAVLRPYAAVVRARFQLLLRYRAAAFAGFVTQCWWGAIKVMVLAAFFRGAATAPMTLRQAIDYVWLGQAFLTLLPWSADPDIARLMRSGDVAYERLRPLDTYAYWYARAVARRTATPLLRALPMVMTAGVILPLLGLSSWGLSLPGGVRAALLFVPSLVLVVALASAVATLLDVLTVVTLSDRGVNTLVGPLVVVLSGNLIPLPLLPDWLHRTVVLLPFAGLVDIPFRIYSGHLAGAAAAGALALQSAWVVILVLLGRFAMARVMRRLEAQGG
jgi:viologen exporter family transport system permease protein